MLYSKHQLQNLSEDEGIIAIKRYLTKMNSNETRKLLPHECDYINLRLRSIYKYDENHHPIEEWAFDPYEYEFLSEALFKFLILVYFHNLDFLKPVFNGPRELSSEEIARDKLKFDDLLERWRSRLSEKKSDPLLHEVKIEHDRKLKIINQLRKNGAFGWNIYQRKCLGQELMAFYTYFTVKAFFKNLKTNFVEITFDEQKFIINQYSYVHIISRHYIPHFNGIDPEKSFNETLPFIDPFNLPSSLAEVILTYFSFAPEIYSLNSEHMIFKYKESHYIIWWKYKPIDEIEKQLAYEIRTLYKMQSATDMALLPNKLVVQVNAVLNFYY